MPCTRVTEGLGPVPDPKYIIKQTGEKETFPGGAQRDTQKDKPRYDLIPPLALRRVADLYTKGAEHYGDRNWEKGMPFSRFFGSLLRHAYQFSVGETDEDHLAAVVFNALAIMHFQETDRTDLDDMFSNQWRGWLTPPLTVASPWFRSRPPEKEPEPFVIEQCPDCHRSSLVRRGSPTYTCAHCGRLYPRETKENPEKPLTSEPPPAKIRAMDDTRAEHPWPCFCRTCFLADIRDIRAQGQKESHPLEED